jgi:hypothetical protein
MIIINNAPTEAFLKRKRDRGEIVRDRKVKLKEFFKRISQCLVSPFKYQVFLKYEDNNDKINQARYSYMREVILSRASYINTSRVRTWNQLNAFYLLNILYTEISLNELKRDLEDELKKLEFDIADLKYPYLEHGRLFNLDLSDSNFESLDLV